MGAESRWRYDYNQAFFDGLRELPKDGRDVVLGCVRAVEADPQNPQADEVRALPPMHAPGTMEATFGDVVIRYVIVPRRCEFAWLDAEILHPFASTSPIAPT